MFTTLTPPSSNVQHPIFTLLLLFCMATPAIAANPATGTPMIEKAPPTGSANETRSRVARAIFTTAIAEREPVDNLESLPNNIQQLYFFSDLRGLAGKIVTHRWEFNDKLMAEITFKVGNGVRWRVYSSKNLLPEWTGTWTVVVSDESGAVLERKSIEYTAVTSSATPAVTSP